ncbi:MAG: hypothetical protein ACRBCK_10860 [Alphaproteobacteria bacterium]
MTHLKNSGGTNKMLRDALINTLLQISEIVLLTDNLPPKDATIFYQDTGTGRHVRHVLDHFLAFIKSYENGVLDYNCRNRDSATEQDWKAAKAQINKIMKALKTLPEGTENLKIISEIDPENTTNETFVSNTARESLYLINHTVHHAAYIKLLAKGCGIELPAHIGIAPATATYLRKAG